MSENYKRLLPAPMPPGSQAKASESAFQKETGPPVKKRTVSKAACNNCRLKKIRVSTTLSAFCFCLLPPKAVVSISSNC